MWCHAISIFIAYRIITKSLLRAPQLCKAVLKNAGALSQNQNVNMLTVTMLKMQMLTSEANGSVIGFTGIWTEVLDVMDGA